MRVELRLRREVFLHDLPLMILAYLDGDTVKNTRNTTPSVENDRNKRVALSFEVAPNELILELRLVAHLVCVQVLVFIGVPRDETAILSSEEGGIDDHNNETRAVYFLRHDNGVEELCHRTRASVYISAKELLGAFAHHKLVPQRLCASRDTPDT